MTRVCWTPSPPIGMHVRTSSKVLAATVAMGAWLAALLPASAGSVAADGVIVFGGASAVSESLVSEIEALGHDVTRAAGPDRYATAAQASRIRFEPQVDVAYVTSGLNYPDGLAAVPLASIERGPLLLVHDDGVPATTETELARLEPARIVVLGGASAVSDAVVAELQAHVRGTAPVERLAGDDRFATAVQVSQALFPTGADRVFLARGDDFADALSAGPAAAHVGGPILFTGPDTLPEVTRAELERLEPLRITIVGGEAAVSAGVEATVRPMAPLVERIFGPDRVATSVAVARAVFGDSPALVFVATADNFPDALTGGAVAGDAGNVDTSRAQTAASDSANPILLLRDPLADVAEAYLTGEDNAAPTATDDAATTSEDDGTTIDVLANDSDPENAPISATSVDTTGTTGTVVDNGDGTVAWDPAGAFEALAPGEEATDTFGYTISDGELTATATVTVTVTGVNDIPVVTTTDLPLDYAEGDGPVALDDGLTVVDVDSTTLAGATVAITAGQAPAEDVLAFVDQAGITGTVGLDGSLTLAGTATVAEYEAALRSVTYENTSDTPDTTPRTVTVVTTDDQGGDSVARTRTIDLDPVNDPPIGGDDDYSTTEDSVLGVLAPGVLTNDTDADGDTLTVTAFDATSTQGAAVTVAADGGVAYDPTGAAALQALAAAATVDDTFTYTVEDPSGATDVVTVTVEVTGVDDAPVAVDDTATLTEDDPATTIDVLGNDTDVDGGPISITGVTQPAGGTVVITNSGADLTYEPDANACNDGTPTDDFTYTLSPGGAVGTVEVTVTCVNDLPTADDESYTTSCNVQAVVKNPADAATADGPAITIVGNILEGDSDPVEGSAISIVEAAGTTTDTTAPFTITTDLGGTVVLQSDGSFAYTPEAGDRGVADSFDYTIEDADGGQDTGTVTLNTTSDCVWFVDNSTNGGADDLGTGTSSDPFTSLVDEVGLDADPDDAEDAASAGDTIYVFDGDSSIDPYEGGIVLQDDQRLLGQGVDLVVDPGTGDVTLVTGALADRPRVVSASSHAVLISDVTGVEVAGMSLDGDLDGVSIQSVAASVDAYVHDNDVIATVDGIGVIATQPVTVRLDENTGIVAGDDGIALNGLGGQLVVESFCGNAVLGDTVDDGVWAANVIFDADPSDADFTGDQVTCGLVTTVGSSGNPVGGDAMSLTGVSGDLGFQGLNLYTDGGGATALDVTGTGLLAPGAGTGFGLTNLSGTASSGVGPAVVADEATIALNFSNVSSTSSPTTGVSLLDVVGSWVASGGNVTGALGDSFLIQSTQADALDVTHHGAISTSNAAAVHVDGHPQGTVVFSSGAITATGGTGLQLDDADGSYTFNGVVVLNGGDAGIDILNGSTGSFTFANTTISEPSGTAVRVDASAPTTATFQAAVTKNNAGRLVDITGLSGGSVTFTGNVAQNHANGTGIRIANGTGGSVAFNGNVTLGSTSFPMVNDALTLTDNTGLTTSFTQGLDIVTNGARGLVGSNGGTLNVTGTGSTVATTSARAVELVSTTIGGSGVTFDSISATGGTNGIVLDTTGAGTFTVTGTGGLCDGVTPTCTGGRITGMTGANGAVAGSGIHLTNTGPVSLTRMRLDGHDNFAVRGTTVGGFSLIDSVVDGVNGTSTAADEGSIRFDNLTGTAAITRSEVSGGFEDNVRIVNTTGTLNATVSDSTIGLNGNAGNDGILVESQNTSTLNLTVTDTTFLGSRGDHVQCNALGSSTMDCTIQDNTFTNTHGNSSGGGVTISGGAVGAAPTVTYDISGTSANSQTFTGAVGTAITVNLVNGTSSASFAGTIANNKIGTSGSAGSGSSGGNGITAACAVAGTHTTMITNNDIDQIALGNGVDLLANGSCSLRATVTGNTADSLGDFALAGLYTVVGGDGAGSTASMCLDASSNSVTAGAFGFDYWIDHLGAAGATYTFPGYGGASTPGPSPNALDAFLEGQNNFTGPAGDSSSATNVSGTGTACPQP